MLKKLLGLILILIALSGLLACASPQQTDSTPTISKETTLTTIEQVVTFKDANLEVAIRKFIDLTKVGTENPRGTRGTPPKTTSSQPQEAIHVSDLEKLTLLLAGPDIKDLSGLEYCTNLETLSLFSNEINDLSPLKGLPKLTQLELVSSQIKDISELASLQNLTLLSLMDNQIRDISPLANLKNLTGLNLCLNKISDISALANLTRLKGLDLQGGPDSNQITDISPLTSLVELNVAVLINNRISDVSPLLSLSNLKVVLILEGNPLSSDSIEKYLPQLKAKGVDVQ